MYTGIHYTTNNISTLSPPLLLLPGIMMSPPIISPTFGIMLLPPMCLLISLAFCLHSHFMGGSKGGELLRLTCHWMFEKVLMLFVCGGGKEGCVYIQQQQEEEEEKRNNKITRREEEEPSALDIDRHSMSSHPALTSPSPPPPHPPTMYTPTTPTHPPTHHAPGWHPAQ